MSVQFFRLLLLKLLMACLLLVAIAHPAFAQDTTIPLRVKPATKINKFVPDTTYAQQIALGIDEGLLAVFPPDGYSGFQFRGRTTVIPVGDRFAINLPSLSVLKPDMGVRFEIGDISLSAKILVDPTVEDNWRFDVTARLPSTIVVRDAVTNEELSRILVGKHEVSGTFEAQTRHFSALKMSFDSLSWQKQMPPDPTDPDSAGLGYVTEPRILASGQNIMISSTLRANAEKRLAGPVSLKMTKPNIHHFQTGMKIFASDYFDWSGEIRDIDFGQYNMLVNTLSTIFVTGVQGYADKGPKIDEMKRSLFFDKLTEQIKSVGPLLNGFDSVLTVNNPSISISDMAGEITAENLTFGLVVDNLMSDKAQVGLRFISNKAAIRPSWSRPDLFPQNLDVRVTIADIAATKLWKIFTEIPADMKLYGELPSLDYAWNKFFYTIASNRASIVVDKSIFRSRDLDSEFVAKGQFMPSSPYMVVGVANVNLIGVDELASKTARAAANLVPGSVEEQAIRKKMYDLSKDFARLRDVGNRGIQREKGMARRYNVEISPNGAIVFSSNNGSMDVFDAFFR